jgi:hypothetical protein
VPGHPAATIPGISGPKAQDRPLPAADTGRRLSKPGAGTGGGRDTTGPGRIDPRVQQRINDLLPVAPTVFPDGSPFPAAPALTALGRAWTQASNFLSPDATVAINA